MFDEFSAYNRNNIGYGDVVTYKIADEGEQGSDINEERDALPGGVVERTITESATPKITAEMSDAERAEILSEKTIEAPIYTGQADLSIYANKSKLESEKIGIVAEVIQKLAQDFGVIGEEIKIEDAEVIIKLSKQNLRKSVTADASPMQLAKLMPVLKATVQKSIGVERHDNRYFFDSDTVYFDNLLGGYIDGNDFVPVRFGLKYNRTGNVVLYVVVDQNKIPLSSLTATKNDRGRQSASLANADSGNSRSVTYSIAQIIKFVNSEDLLRYIPDEMLTEVQKTTKYDAMAKTIERTNTKNDERYMEYISNGNLDAAKQMVFNAAKENGYTVEAYHGTDAEFTVFDYGKIGSSTGVSILGDGFYFTNKKSLATGYGGKIYAVFLKSQNPYNAVVDDSNKLNTSKLQEQRYDSVKLSTQNGDAYLVFENTQIDGNNVTLKLTIRKSLQKNKFWVHGLETIEKVSNPPADTNNGIKTGSTIADISDIVTQPKPIVKKQLKKLPIKFLGILYPTKPLNRPL